MNAGKSFKKDAKSLFHYNAQTANNADGEFETNSAQKGVADIKLNGTVAELKDPSFNTLVFPLGQKGIKSVGTDGSYTFRKRQTASANTTGKFALEGLSADQTFGIGESGHANEIAEKDFVIIPQANGQTINLATQATTSGDSVKLVTNCPTTALRGGDFVKFIGDGSDEIRQIDKIISPTSFKTTTNVGDTYNANAAVVRFFPDQFPISLHDRNDANIAISSANSLVFTVSETNLQATMAVSVIHDVNDTTEPGRTKVIESTEVAIDCGANSSVQPGGTSGPWSLGVPDAFELTSVLVLSLIHI